MRFSAGEKIGGYELLVFCGKGGFGQVWLARGFDGGRVALKIIPAEEGRKGERELAGLRAYQSQGARHSNLIRIFHAAQEPGFLYYTMEAADSASPDRYIPMTLARKLESGRLSASETAALLKSILDGLEQLHQAGLIHRDIKPENILFVDGTPKLADLSLIRDPVRSASPGGTPGFQPPEISGRREDDYYALCMTGYCAATGLSPGDFPRKPENMPLSEYASIRRLFITGCNRDPRLRFHSAEEMRSVLRGGGKCRPNGRPLLFAAAAILCIAAGLTAFFLLSSGDERKNPPPVKPQETADEPAKKLSPNADYIVSDDELLQFESTCRTMAEAMHEAAEGGSFHRERDLAVEARYRRWLLRTEEIRRLPPEERNEPWQALMAEARGYVMK